MNLAQAINPATFRPDPDYYWAKTDPRGHGQPMGTRLELERPKRPGPQPTDGVPVGGVRQNKILVALRKAPAGGMDLAQMMAATKLTKYQVGPTLWHMEKKGYIKRTGKEREYHYHLGPKA